MNAILTVAVTLLYLIPVALVALLLTAQRRPHAPWLLTAVLLALPAFYMGHYLLLQQIQGWPSSAPLPQQFRLLAFDISEPDPKTERAGQILLWVHGGSSDQPRVHHLAYRKDLHQELIAAGKRQVEGRPQIGIRRTQTASSAAGPSGGKQETISFRDKVGRSLPSKP
jgi:hypothetical protein